MKIILNGEPLPGIDLKVKAVMKIADEDASGSTSATTRVETGIKAIQLNCNLVIKADNAKDLKTLTDYARATDENGKRTVYTVVNETAKAMSMKQATFTDNFIVNPLGGTLRGWKVAFSLIEVQSVPEKVERQKNKANSQSGSASANNSASANQSQPAGDAEQVEQKREFSDFEKFLDSVNTFLGDLKK